MISYIIAFILSLCSDFKFDASIAAFTLLGLTAPFDMIVSLVSAFDLFEVELLGIFAGSGLASRLLPLIHEDLY